LFRWYPTPLRGIDANIEHESGTSPEAFRARSAIMHVDSITAPILILHGAQDERVLVRQAEAFAEALRAKQMAVTVNIFPPCHAWHSARGTRPRDRSLPGSVPPLMGRRTETKTEPRSEGDAERAF
jgi:dipeptidyl aminopeptidase/acylaminoacyl peptidase